MVSIGLIKKKKTLKIIYKVIGYLHFGEQWTRVQFL